MPAGDAPPERPAFTDEVLLPDELVQVAWSHPGRQRLPLGGRLEERFGSGTEASPGGWHAPMVSRRVRPIGGWAPLDDLERDPGDLGHDPQPDEQADERPTHDGDSSDVACHVGVLVCCRGRQWRGGPDDGIRGAALRSASAALLRPALLGHDRGLELGGAGLLLGSERCGARRRGLGSGSRGRGPGARRAGSRSGPLERSALAGSGRGASGALGHEPSGSSVRDWVGRDVAAPRPGRSTPEDTTRRDRAVPRLLARPSPPTAGYVRANPCLLDSNRPSEDPRIDLDALIEPNLGALVVGLIAALLALATGSVILARRTRDLDARLRGITRGAEGRSLEAVLDAHLEKVYALSRQLDDVAARTAILEAAQRRSFQRVGLVRYNPFEETGGNQSFALALLDAAGDGWVLSSLHARSGTRVYAKAITGGRSDAGLSAEETAAIAQATA